MLDTTAKQDVITIRLDGEPRGKGRPRFRVVTPHGKPSFVSTYTDAATRDYESDLRVMAKSAMLGRQRLAGPVLVRVVAQMAIPQSWPIKKQRDAIAQRIRPTGKPDCDNILKVIDALNGVVWDDDSQVVSAFVSKVYSDTPALVIEAHGSPAPKPEPALFVEEVAEVAQ